MSRFIEPPGFISESKSFETYQKDLERWALLTSVEEEKQALMVLHYLDGHKSGIKEKVDAQIEEKDLQKKDGIQTLLKFFEKIYKKDSLADGFDKYIEFEKLRRSPNTSIQEFIPEWNTSYSKAVNVGCSLSDKVLAFKLLDAANLSSIERNLVLTGVNYEAAGLKDQMEAALRKFVGRSVLSGEVKRIEDSTFVTSDNLEQVLLSKGWTKHRKKRNASPNTDLASKTKVEKRNWIGKDGKIAKCFKCKCDHEKECNCPCTYHVINQCPENQTRKAAKESNADLGLFMQSNGPTLFMEEVESSDDCDVVLVCSESNVSLGNENCNELGGLGGGHSVDQLPLPTTQPGVDGGESCINVDGTQSCSSWQSGLTRNLGKCSFQLRVNWGAGNEIKRTLRVADSNFYARYTNGNRTNRGIKLCHWNAGNAHLRNKMNSIESVVSRYSPQILGISEANLLKKHDLSEVQIEDYELVTSLTMDNANLEYSRVIVYKHSSIISRVRKDLMSNKFSSIWLECGLPRKRKFLVCNLYREWQYLGQGGDKSSREIQQQLSRWIIFIDQFERALNTGMEVYCMGDVNLDFLTWTKTDLNPEHRTVQLKQLIVELFDRVLSRGVKQCVTAPTRSWPGQADSGIDHFYTNAPNKISAVQVSFEGASDHRLIHTVRFSTKIKSQVRYVEKRSYKNFDENKFREDFNKTSWWTLYNCTDVNQAVEIFTTNLTSLLDKHAPVRRFQTRKKYSPWLSTETKQLLKERNQAQMWAASTKNPDDWSAYKKLRNKATKQLKIEKSSWQKNKLELCSNDSGKLWSNVKGWLNWSSVSSPTKLFNEGSIETSPRRLATIMNNFYINKVNQIRENLPYSNIDPLQQLRQMRNGSNSLFTLQPVHPELVCKIIGELRNSKSTGLDNIDTFVLKIVRNEITPAVTHIVNLSINSSTFPTLWKHAKVIPLLKPGSDDQLDPKSYRPVALLPVVSKVLERVIFLQTVQYLNDHNLLHPNHHGFRSQHSTTTAMLQMYDSWVEAANRGEMAGVAMIDQSAAFDCVDHTLLIDKLKLYGWEEKTLDWTINYLSDREQSCSVESFLSQPIGVKVGVPQGSILGPLYYCIFTNDFPEIVHEQDCPGRVINEDGTPSLNMQCRQCGGIVVYADDSTYTVTDSDKNNLSTKLSHKFELMAGYLTANKLKVNSDKTHLIVMCTDQRRRHHATDASIITGTEVIEVSTTERLLGAYIHQGMKWTEYIRDNGNSLLHDLSTRLGGLKKISKAASFKARLTVANGIFMSKMIFMIPLWAGCQEFLINALQVIQNKAARTVTKHDMSTPVQQLLKECGWRSVRQEMHYHTILQVHKTLVQRNPMYLYSKLTADSSYAYRTRQNSTISIRQSQAFKTKLTLCKESFRWRGTAWYESLPWDLRGECNLKIFKKKLNTWVRNNVTI